MRGRDFGMDVFGLWQQGATKIKSVSVDFEEGDVR